MPTSMDERDSFYYRINNIINDRTRYNYCSANESFDANNVSSRTQR